MLTLVPPAGTPISIFDVISILRTRFVSANRTDSFFKEVRAFSGAKYLYGLNSGRAALSVILNAMAADAAPGKNEVIIPAYTCFSVAAAIAACNLKIRLVDINPATLDYDYEKLCEISSERTLAIVGCNLFGIASNWKELQAFAKTRNIYLIDDAAQAMGSVYNSKPLGTNGDAGFYSLGRGKSLSTYSGGIIVTDDDNLNLGIAKQMQLHHEPGFIGETNIFAKIFLYALFLNPYLYRLAASMPFLGIGKTEFDLGFKPAILSKIQIFLGGRLIPKIAKLNSIRMNNAEILANALNGSKGRQVIGWPSKYKINYLRLPVLFEDGATRDKAIDRLRKIGISASAMYPSTIRNIPGIEPYLADISECYDGADTVVGRLLTLPTHPNLKSKDIHNIISCLDNL
jgi:perosamine synthetase